MRQAISKTARRLAILGTAAVMVSGCKLAESPVFDPAGPIARQERDLLVWAFALMMIVAIPVFLMTALFAIRYRQGASPERYRPGWSGSRGIESVIWLVPALIVLALGTLVWSTTHRVDPYRTISAPSAPLRIQAIALDWKWLFIFPDQGIATVNEMTLPLHTPIEFEITADTVMNSLYIPRLAGQIYAMPGMRTKLNLLADRAGEFTGRNAQYSGRGFSGQHFKVRTSSPDDFWRWVSKVRSSTERLDLSGYDRLAIAKANAPVMHFGTIAPSIFDKAIGKHHAADPVCRAGPRG